jgi:hypothetical protein
MTLEAPAALAGRVARAVAARATLARRPLRDTIAALAAAGARWRDDASLAALLPDAARLDPTMVRAILPLAAAALDRDAVTALVERELGAGAAARPAPAGPACIAHVLAGNVPALALPAAALGCLVGAAVVLKSGRGDPLSAPAFVRAVEAVDPLLGATLVAAYWPGGDLEREGAALGGADVVVATGGAPALAALRARVRARLVPHGPRTSVVAVAGDADADAVARDVALYEQRGCLSPHAVWVAGDSRAFAERLAAALADAAARLAPAPATIEERAALRVAREEAFWTSGAAAWSGPGGTVLHEPDAAFRPTCGLRTVRVHRLPALDALADRLPAAGVECVALAGADARALLPALRARGVARICRPGRMQEPPLAWPRGQLAPLGVLLGREEPPRCDVDA